MRQPIAVEDSITLPFPPEQLWRYVADSARMDRAVGLPRVSYERVERGEGGEDVTGEYRVLGWAWARWQEHPFAWERPRHYSVVREYSRGPLARFFGGADLTPVDDQDGADGSATRVRVFAAFTPRSLATVPLVRFYIAPLSIRRAIRQYRSIAAYLQGSSTQPFDPTLRLAFAGPRPDVERLLARLEMEGVTPAPAARLAALLAEGDDESVVGMRPLELAADWGTDPRETMEAFLRATVAGVLEMRWELICPSCRGVKAEADHLNELDEDSYCPACNMPISANVDEAIEARYYPARGVRKLNVGTYCVGGPLDTPHRLAQTTVTQGQAAGWQLALAPGPYTVRSPQSRGNVRIDADPATDCAELEIAITSTMMLPDAAVLRPGPVTVRLVNETAHRLTAVLDDARWTQLAVTPSKLMTLPAFRALFSAEALAAGVELSIARAGLLFTDLAGSTALYERAGEARAFRLVAEHFTILRAAIEAHDGAVVKTIGDAVMGAFQDAESTLAAALAIQREIRRLDTGGLADPRTLLKVGVHAGPCYAVTLNERLDYFGAAVNLAARAQHEARGGQIVASAAVYESAPRLVAAAGLRAEPFEVVLRGLSAPMRLYRIECGGTRDAGCGMRDAPAVADAATHGRDVWSDEQVIGGR
jgi:class 3 adenylate cyclase